MPKDEFSIFIALPRIFLFIAVPGLFLCFVANLFSVSVLYLCTSLIICSCFLYVSRNSFNPNLSKYLDPKSL